MAAPISWITVHSENVYTVLIDGKGMLISPIFMLFNQRSILTTVTKNPDVVTEWISVRIHDVIRHVGFEVEFHNDDISRIGAVQLCIGKCCLIFLGSRTKVFVGTNILFKIQLLRQQCPFSEVVSFMEMGHYVPLLDSIELGEVQKEWARPTNLSLQQVQYACLDAFLSIYIAASLWNLD